ncbi:hypothetical protein [Polyangium mundeleinium]|uniref:Uncharacterized protein n=1 Tax=Polyangium mundeleinium TaxID=2995306 RepID=A0ABT5F789_9BACT|nr:hypothetical protein [Polyangium mundeleinium]MDC0749972.1 hypothetical protein [Polyangium mundeleinium]
MAEDEEVVAQTENEEDDREDAPTIVLHRPPGLTPRPPVPLSKAMVAEHPWWRRFLKGLCFWRKPSGSSSSAPVLLPTTASSSSSPSPDPARSTTSSTSDTTITRRAGRRTTPTLVSPPSPGRRAVVDELHGLLWGFEQHELEDTVVLIGHILTVRRAGPEARVDAQILHALLHLRVEEDGTVPLVYLRGKVAGLARSVVDEALLRLEEQGRVLLLPEPPTARTRQAVAAIEHPTRGLLDRCALPTSVDPRATRTAS